MIYTNENKPAETADVGTTFAIPENNPYLQTLVRIANDSEVAMKALCMLENIKDEDILADSVRTVTQH